MMKTKASPRMNNLFIDFHTLLRQHDLNWLVSINQNVAVKQVLGAIKPMIRNLSTPIAI